MINKCYITKRHGKRVVCTLRSDEGIILAEGLNEEQAAFLEHRVNHHAELVELVDSAATALEMAGYMETASMLRGKLAGLDTKKD